MRHETSRINANNLTQTPSVNINNTSEHNDSMHSVRTPVKHQTDAMINTTNDIYANAIIAQAPNERMTNISHLTMYGSHRAEESFALLPKWLWNYFEWHKQQTQNRTKDTNYIVSSCHGNRRWGGVSDRLRPLPFYLLYASLVKRVLCIHWIRPFGLENYLMPPVDSAGRVVDWRCPADVPLDIADKNVEDPQRLAEDLFFRCLEDTINCAERDIQQKRTMKAKYVFIDLPKHTPDRINAANHLFQYHTYADKMPDTYQWQFVDLMGDIFRVMFEPVPALAESINNTMTNLGLREHEYTSVHVRSRYPIRNKFRSLDLNGGLKLE